MNCFFPDLTKKVKRHRAMISLPETQWKVTEELEEEFNELKAYLQSHVQLSPIRVGEPLNLYTDASVEGLSFVLTQERKQTEGETERIVRDIIYLGSTSLSDTQKRYSPVELESLALAWAVGKTHYYLYEAPKVTHYTDSTGVVGLRKKDLSDVKNPRIQRILEKVMPYNISSTHIPASQNGISDYLSRHPSSKKCLAEEFSLETPKFRVNIEGKVKIGKKITLTKLLERRLPVICQIHG